MRKTLKLQVIQYIESRKSPVTHADVVKKFGASGYAAAINATEAGLLKRQAAFMPRARTVTR